MNDAVCCSYPSLTQTGYRTAGHHAHQAYQRDPHLTGSSGHVNGRLNAYKEALDLSEMCAIQCFTHVLNQKLGRNPAWVIWISSP